MCGICGIQYKDTSREVDTSVVGRMNDALVHRGPDDEGVRTGGHIALGARVPLLDHRIVEFAATLPFHLKYSDGVSKRVLKHAMKGILPESSLRQRKRGFSIPIHRWFRKELNDYFQDAVLTHDSRCREFLDMSEVKRLVDVHQAGSENYGHHLWVVLMFEHWLGYASKIPEISLSL